MKPLLTGDAAERLGVSSERVRQLERNGLLKSVRTPRGTRVFWASAVEKLIQSRGRGATPRQSKRK